MKKQTILASTMLMIGILLASCSGVGAVSGQSQTAAQNVEVQATATAVPEAPVQPVVVDNGLLAAYENALTEIYDGVNPSVVSIVVLTQQGGAQGSGFVWDTSGHIITNNHVIDGADSVQVEFFDGTIVSAEVVGSDSYSDLAVLKVDVSASFLVPVQLADSDTVKVGQLAIAIGNPFALENTMTVGIVSALGRSIPAGETNQFSTGPTYSIPDIIQTDAPINPGNSGGVLVNDQGQVIGVTAAIESPSQANAGIGFVIPSNIVSRVVPVLIDKGEYQHPYLGLTGTRLIPDFAKAMNLAPEQRGALVVAVTDGGPAADAGLKGSNNEVDVNGQQYPVGGDVITAIDGNPIQDMDGLIAYLFSHTEVGQKVTLTILRNGKEMQIDVTLKARPAMQSTPQTLQANGSSEGSAAYLGISGYTITSALSEALDLPANTEGVLVEEVQSGSPADEAGLKGGTESMQIQGQEIMTGGDIIIGFDDQPVQSIQELVFFIGIAGPGEQVNLTILRNGEEIQIPVTLQAKP